MANKLSLAKGFLKVALPVLALLAIGLNWHSTSAQSRQIRVVNSGGISGQNVNVAVELVAQGNENALGFSLNFPTAVLSNPTAAIGSGAVGATLNVNTLQAASNGRVGVAMALPTGQVFASGTRQLIVLTFAIAANAPGGTAAISFGDLPIAREVSDASANSLATTYVSGEVVIQQPNPVPALTSMNPTSAAVGTNGLTLTVNGSNFVALSTVRWNGATRTTQLVNNGQLTATILPNDLATAGTATVDVINPSPGGGTSNSLLFSVNNPAPTITSLNPSSTTSGGAAFTLTVNGTGFVSTSTVWWNGAQRTTQVVSATQLTASISAADIASAGTASVVVQNPAPGGGSSPAATFSITNPAPTITSLSPSGTIAGNPAFTLTVNGTGFIGTSSVWWNGTQRTTQVVSATQLTASISAADIASAGTASVVVQNPAPGGGSSPGMTFTISQPPTAQIAISPANPTTNDDITIQLSGTWPDGCVPMNPQLTVNGNELRIDTTNASQVCATVLTPWTLNVPAGKRAAGNYTVRVVHTANSVARELGTRAFTVNNPAPTINSLNPSSATAGGAAFTLTVNGTNFVSTSTVWWNGAQRTTQFVSATQLTASITASDIASAGTASVVVQSPAPGGGSSPAATFTINSATPAPTLTSVNPSVVVASGAAFTLTVNGTNFVNNSAVNWNGNARTTTFVSATQLTAAIPATDIAAAGTAMVTVVTPAPGGGTSNALSVTIASPVASVSAASFLGAELAPNSIIAAFGVNLATGVEIGNSSPLPTMLLGTKVSVRDSAGTERLAPLFFVAPTQVNYLMPEGTVPGRASVTITSGDNKISIGSPMIAAVAPGLFTANSSGQGVPAANIFRLKANGEQSTEPLARFDSTTSQFVPIPIDLGPEGEQVFGILFGSGFRSNTGLAAVSVKIGGVESEVLYAGEAPGFFGLDQCNVRIPRSVGGRGDVDLVLTVNGKVANTVRINIK
jgi:uncharacterized protein (TIGR03437 family)